MAILGKKHLARNVKIIVTDTAPVDGTSGTGAKNADPGSLLIRTGTTPQVYVNRNTKASPLWESGTKIVTVVAAGRNGAGAITATGFAVGDRVFSAVNLTDGTDDAASFEATITVANQIQQSSVSNLTTKKYIFQARR